MRDVRCDCGRIALEYYRGSSTLLTRSCECFYERLHVMPFINLLVSIIKLGKRS